MAHVREAHGLSRRQLANVAGWTVGRVAALEEGSAEVEWLAVLDLLEAMGADSGELSAAYAQFLVGDSLLGAEEGRKA